MKKKESFYVEFRNLRNHVIYETCKSKWYHKTSLKQIKCYNEHMKRY